MTIRILTVDDHAIFRSGLRALLRAEAGLEVAGEASDGATALEILRKEQFDVLLLDLSLPGGLSGPRVAEESMTLAPGMAVVVLTMHDEEYYLREMFQIGVRAFVLKRSPPAVLLAAIRAARRGEQFVDPALMSGFVDAYMGRKKQAVRDARADLLTEREREVCQLVALGHTNNEVAEKLYISPRTVETHRRNIMARLELRNRAELVRFAMDNGIVKPE